MEKCREKIPKKLVWPRREDTPCCEKVFVSVDVWTEAERWNVGMKFGEEGTMKNVWVGAAGVRKVKKKKGMVNIQRSEGWETGAEARQKDKLE